MKVLKSGETLIAKEEDFTSGSLKVNDAYDIYLAKQTSGDYILIIFMKLQFIFKDNNPHTWTELEKTNFVKQFEQSISRKWGNRRVVKTLSGGKKVQLDFRFEMITKGWSISEHWEIKVKKIKVGGFDRSFVNPFWGNVSLDSEDINFVNKGYKNPQRGVVHEFGHMLGLEDEYLTTSKHLADLRSIMHSGEDILHRHDAPYIKWLEETLKSKKIK